MEENNNPLFNSGISYLQRIDWLMQVSHRASAELNEGETLEAYFIALQKIHTEILPRATNREELEEAEEEAEKYSRQPSNNKTARKKLLIYERLIHITAHELGLIMPNKDSLQNLLGQQF